jgi:chromate transport protein ChrA
MNIFFWGISILITLYTGWRYIPEILKWNIKPHAFSWLPWTILVSVAFIIQIQNGEDIWWFGSLAASTLVCAIVFLLSFKYGEKNITVSDTLSLIGSLVLIVFWLIIQNDFWALVLICIIDALSFYPTWRKSWRKPREENISMYSLSSLKSLLSIFALQNPIFINWFYPLFLTLINLSFAVYLVWRRKIIKN